MAGTQTSSRPLIAISMAASSRSSVSCASSTWSVGTTDQRAAAQRLQLDHNFNNIQEFNKPASDQHHQPADINSSTKCDSNLLTTPNQQKAATKKKQLGHKQSNPTGNKVVRGGGGGGHYNDIGELQGEEEKRSVDVDQHDKDVQQPARDGLSNVDQVRDNFIVLIRYNKLQYFYIGAIIYSVINLLFFFIDLVMMRMHQPESLDEMSTNCQQLIWTTSRRDNEIQSNISWLMIILIILINLALVSIVAFTLIGFNSMEYKSKTTTTTTTNRSINRISNQSIKWLLHCVGIFLATILLVMPIEIIYVKNVAQNYSNVTQLIGVCRQEWQPNDIRDNTQDTSDENDPKMSQLISLIIANCRLPVGVIGALLYSLPLLLEDAPTLAKLICACLMLPPILVVPLEYLLIKQQQQQQQPPPTPSISEQESFDVSMQQEPINSSVIFVPNQEMTFLNFSMFYLLITFIAGLLKRYQLSNFVRRVTFDGANELIEAKVSLEQQRQQQETLLLSVLPAYVAEQVKRNMVKKMTSLDDQTSVVMNNNTSFAPTEVHLINPSSATSATVTTLAGQQQQQVNLQPTGVGRGSFIMAPSEAKSSNPTGDGGGGGSSTRSSFIKSSSKFLGELSMGLKSPQSNSANNHTGNQSASNNNNNPHQQGNHLLLAPNQSQLSIQSNINLSAGGGGGSSQARRGFNELYIRTYNNVSLLYGDIVGFTRLCTQLSSSQLVSVLNDLFSHFDHLAERHKIMRIKILGDCYYGVSGIPEFAVMGAKSRAKSNENHAINCVNMGLDMIQYIKCLNIERSSTSNNMASDGHCQMITVAGSGGGGLSHSVSANDQSMSATEHPSSSFVRIGSAESRPTRQSPQAAADHQSSGGGGGGNQKVAGSSCSVGGQLETITVAAPAMPAFELNMRIGVHTGHIHSGVIGLKKWQFDVWSNDVSIAMHCESSGVAGRVQVTEATVQHLHGSFALELAPRSDRDAYLADKEIKTYLIRERAQSSLAPSLGLLSQPVTMTTSDRKQQPQQQSATNNKRNRSAKGMEQPAVNIGNTNEGREMDEEKIREATIGTIRQTLLAGEAANASSMNAYGLALDHNDMSPIDLQFNESSLEKLYHKRLVSSGSILFELIVLFLLLALVVSFIDFQLGGSFVRRRERLVVVFVLIIGLLLVAYLLLPQHHLEKTTSNGQRGSKRGSSLYRGLDLTKNLDIIVDDDADNNNNTNNNNNNHQSAQFYKSMGVQSRNSLDFIKKSPVVDQLRLAIRSFCWPTFRFICMLWARQRRVNGNKLSPMFGIIIFMCVILIQVYLLLGQYCHELANLMQANEPTSVTTNSQHFLTEQYQMTVIIIIIALDSSVHLVSYRRKHKLLMGLVLLQVIVLSTSFNNTRTRLSMKHEHFTQMVCNCFIDNHLNEALTTTTATNQTTAAGGHHENNGKTTTNQQFIYWSSDALLLVLALWSLAYNRQLDYSSRTNFLWRQRLNVDHEELEYISGINKVLLENILPSHVVQHYLTNPSEQVKSQFASIGRNISLRMSFSNMRNLHDELYHEQHDSVAVMFASIPHFYEFYDESDISKQGLGCIALLNEIICDFDKLLLKNKFSRIEKIKTIGSTYMAAAGLRPTSSTSSNNLPGASPYSLSHRNSAVSQMSQGSGGAQLVVSTSLLPTECHDNHLSPSVVAPAVPSSPDELKKQVIGQQKMNLICMIQFATSLMTALNGINKQSFQVFKLRVGVNTGPVIAGVIGAQRPFYDIWGDCVNIASRMESLGEVGRIQVEERTAKLLLECLCNDSYSIVKRGPIDVKGKGGMVTYFVDKKQIGGGGGAGGSCSSPVQASQVVGGFSGNKGNNDDDSKQAN